MDAQQGKIVMLAVIICNVCTVAMLIGLLAGIVAGFIAGRIAIVEALAFDAYADVTPPAVAAPRRWQPV